MNRPLSVSRRSDLHGNQGERETATFPEVVGVEFLSLGFRSMANKSVCHPIKNVLGPLPSRTVSSRHASLMDVGKTDASAVAASPGVSRCCWRVFFLDHVRNARNVAVMQAEMSLDCEMSVSSNAPSMQCVCGACGDVRGFIIGTSEVISRISLMIVALVRDLLTRHLSGDARWSFDTHILSSHLMCVW